MILSISRIASKRIEREQKNADPLVDLSQEPVAIENDLADLDDFESGHGINEEMNDEQYGI